MTPNNIILGIIILVLLGFTIRYQFLLRASKNHIRELQSELMHLQLENLFSSEETPHDTAIVERLKKEQIQLEKDKDELHKFIAKQARDISQQEQIIERMKDWKDSEA